MRKLLLLTMLLTVVLLSGCSADMSTEDPGGSSTFDSFLRYDYDTLKYVALDQSDVLYGIGNVTTDYIIMTNRTEQLSDDETEAYKSAFTVLDEVASVGRTFSFDEFTTYSSSDIEDFANEADVEITVTDIISIYNVKATITSSAQSDISTDISKQEYIEQRIDRELTTEELQGFYILQENYYELIINSAVTFSFETNSFEELLILFGDNIGYIPLEGDLPKLEAAYTIINRILLE